MKPKPTLALLIALVALVGAYWFSLHSEDSANQRTQEAKKLFSFEGADVRAIFIRRPNEQTIAAERDDSGPWRIIKPHATTAAEPAWQRVVDAFATMISEQTIDNPLALSTYGLEEPGLEISVQRSNGEEHRIAFGATELMQVNRYALAPDGSLILVPDRTYQEFDRVLLELRNRYLFADGQIPFTRMAFTRFKEGDEIDVTRPEEEQRAIDQQTVAFELNDATWDMTAPMAALANQEKVSNLLQEMRFAVGDDYVDAPESLEDYGLSPASARLTVSFADGRPDHAVYFGDFVGPAGARQVYAKRSDGGAVMTIDPSVLRAFPQAPMAFREYRLLARGVDGLNTVRYTSPTESFTLSLDEKIGWHISEPKVMKSNQLAISSLVSYLTSVEGLAFPGEALPEFGLDTPSYQLALSFDGESDPVSLRFGAPARGPDTRYATQDTGEVIIIEQMSYDALKMSLFSFRSKGLMLVRAEEVAAVAMEFDGESYRFAKQEGRWIVEAPANKVWERQSDMGLLVDAIRKTAAVAIQSTENPNLTAYGLDAPLLTVDVTLADDAVDRDLPPFSIGAVSAVDSQQRYATVAGSGEVVRVSQSAIGDVREALRGVVDRE